MALGTRELLMVIRARDVASRVLREVGTNVGGLGNPANASAMALFNLGAALTGVGVTFGTVGAAGLAFFNDATDAAIAYNREAALTKTQVDDVSVSVSQLADIGRRVAAEIPAPFDQMQTALYDIFSSMDVGVVEAERLLRQFSIGAVAGQVDIQTAARSTISILNAYQLPVSEVNRIMDLQFQLVRKGVGTYEEFNTALGRAIPAAVSAGQSVETLAGMMAFLTRNGLSTEMAATSAARAMELFSDPKRFHKLEDMGITVRNSAGEFLQMNEIISQLASNSAWAKMAEPQRKELFQEIFGQGTIQARRFFDTAIPNWQQLNALTGDMANSAGALDAAYLTMFVEPATQAQLLANKYEILKTEIGEELIPIKLKLMETVMKVIDWWNNLDEGTQDLIIKFGLFAATALTIVGIILTVVGAFMMLVGVMAPVVGGIGAAIAIISGVGVAVVAIIGIIALLIIHWDTLKRWAGIAWEFIQEKASEAWQLMQSFWDWLSRNAVSVWHDLHGAAVNVWGTIQGAASKLWGWLRTAYAWLDEKFGAGFRRIWQSASEAAKKHFEEIRETVETVMNVIDIIVKTILIPAFNAIKSNTSSLADVVVGALEFLAGVWEFWFNIIWEITQVIINNIKNAWEIGLGIIMSLWERFGPLIMDYVVNVWDFISSIISAAIEIISNIIGLFLNIIQGDWGEAWDNIKNIFGAAWDAVYAALLFVGRMIQDWFMKFPGAVLGFIGDVASLLWNKGWDIMTGLFNGIKNIALLVADFFLGLPGKIIGWIGDLGSLLWSAGADLVTGFLNGIRSKVGEVSTLLSSAADNATASVKSALGIHSPSTVFQAIGKDTMEGLLIGLKSKWGDVSSFVTMASDLLASPSSTTVVNTPTGMMSMAPQVGQGGTQPQYGFYVENLNVQDEKVVEDMNWWYLTQTAGV